MAYIRPSGLEVVEKVLLETELLEEYGVYDFGVGWTVAPVPDLGEPGYLKDHMVAIERIRKTEEDPKVVTGFKVDLQFLTPEQLKEGLLKAVEHNKTQTKNFEIL